MEGRDDPLILQAIRYGCLAGSCSYWARREPAAAPGLNRMRRKYRALGGALLAEIVARSKAGPSGVPKSGGDRSPRQFKGNAQEGQGDGIAPE